MQEMKIRDKKERNQKIAVNAMEQIKKWRQGLKDSINSAA
jgi:folate-dependent tRNA-U54 methylase TrmFO/GidA